MDSKHIFYMIKCAHMIMFIIYANFLMCQVADNFNDGDFTDNPVWEGDTEDFVINDKLQLQLDASEAGRSLLYTFIPSFEDSTAIEFYGQLDFNPSSSNRLRIHYLKESLDPESNGFTLEIGESGSDDALRFFKYEDGVRSSLATGVSTSVAEAPVIFTLRIERLSDGMWVVKTSYTQGGVPLYELEYFDNLTIDSGYFIIECLYTSTRVDKFFFDDIAIAKIIPDTVPPSITSVEVTTNNDVVVCFDEAIRTEISNAEVSVDPGDFSPISLTYSIAQTCVTMTFEDDFMSGVSYTLSIDNLIDLDGNGSNVSFEFQIPRSVMPGEIVINELLFDPFPGGDDFIEFYNTTDEALSLQGYTITNEDNGESEVIENNIIISPGGYVAFTPDPQYLEDNYIILDPNTVYRQSLPSFPNGGGEAALVTTDGNQNRIIDRFIFDEELHHVLIDDTEGVSLERKNPNSPSEAENWTSASSIAGFATPGYKNSALIASDPMSKVDFNIENIVVSPNGDGTEDLVVIDYVLDRDSYVLHMKVFDISGNFVKDVYTSELLSTEGTLVWDGTGKNNENLELGIYILWFEIFTPDGEVIYFKKTAVIADFLD